MDFNTHRTPTHPYVRLLGEHDAHAERSYALTALRPDHLHAALTLEAAKDDGPLATVDPSTMEVLICCTGTTSVYLGRGAPRAPGDTNDPPRIHPVTIWASTDELYDPRALAAAAVSARIPDGYDLSARYIREASEAFSTTWADAGGGRRNGWEAGQFGIQHPVAILTSPTLHPVVYAAHRLEEEELA